MWPFWLLFLIPASAVLLPYRLPRQQATFAWVVVGIIFTLMMGLRHEVGGDWINYLPQFDNAQNLTFSEILLEGDPGYVFLNWLVGRIGGNIYGVNLICAVVTMWGTIAFCRRQPHPWLALTIAVPYMLIVVGMGYTRQGVALGFALLGLCALGRGQVLKFIIWVAIGATVHKSAVLLLPIAALATSKNRAFSLAMVGASTLLMYYLLIADNSEAMWMNYVDAQMQSEGGLVRVLMNVVPAFILFVFRKELVSDPQERRLWLWIAVFAVVCLPLVGLASTAVDRVALYLIPLQLFVFARVPTLASTIQVRTILVVSVVAYYALVQFVWLNFATHAYGWVPYQFMPLG